MRIIEIKQLNNGSQPRPYADHIYKWKIKVIGKPSKEDLLEFCQKYLEFAPLERTEYLAKYRSNLPFNEHMRIVCGGWYTLSKTEDYNVWEYLVQREYID